MRKVGEGESQQRFVVSEDGEGFSAEVCSQCMRMVCGSQQRFVVSEDGVG